MSDTNTEQRIALAKRIASALERIADALEGVHETLDCVVYEREVEFLLNVEARPEPEDAE